MNPDLNNDKEISNNRDGHTDKRDKSGQSTKNESNPLEIEYHEVCEDWRQRDNYVLNKLGTAALLYGIIGIAYSDLSVNEIAVKLFLLGVGFLFSLILTISVAKDTYYQNGSEKLIRDLALRLGIINELQQSEFLKRVVENESTLEFPRKIYILRDDISIKLPKLLRNRLLNRTTFNWILAFYLISCLIFFILFVLVFISWVFTLNIPI